MVIDNLKDIIGLAFNLFGLTWSFFDEALCQYFCNGMCSGQGINCSSLFLFVGIVLMVTGYCIIYHPQLKREEKLLKELEKKKKKIEFVTTF